MTAILNVLRKLAIMAIDLLPDSPFRGFIDSIGDIPYLGYLNYFIPISDFLALLSVWTVAIGIFYIVSAVLRTVNAID